MRKREAIEPRKPVKAEADALTVAAGSNAQTRDKDAQVPPGSESVASVQGSSSVPGRSDGFRKRYANYNTRTRAGKYRLGIRTSKKKLKAKRQAMKAWLRTRLTEPVDLTMRRLAAALRGHNNYYGVNGNLEAIQKFYYYVLCGDDAVQNVESAQPTQEYGLRQVLEDMGLLHKAAQDYEKHLEWYPKECLKSRMRQSRTYGSVRGGGSNASRLLDLLSQDKRTVPLSPPLWRIRFDIFAPPCYNKMKQN